MRALYIFALTLLLTSRAFATVTLITTASNLKTATNSPMPVTGLVLLVASTTDNVFAPPSPNTFVTGDDIIVGRWDLSALDEPGLLLDLTTIALSGDWNAGDPLKLYWFPTLTLATLIPGAEGVPYGAYRADLTPDDGDPWITPADGATIDLVFLTADSPVGGSTPSAAGDASLIVKKAPATVTLDGLTQVFNGNARIVTAATAPVGLNVNVTYNGSLTAPTNAGLYTVIGTVDNTNYSGSVTNTLTVNPKAATVVADAKSKIYGEASPALTAVVTGTVGSDTLNYTLATTALINSGVGSYPITVTLGANPNYSVTKTDSSLTVSPKAATVVAEAKSKIYGEASPALTAVVTGTVGPDTLNYTLATTALINSGVGSYPITVTLGANPNYSVTKTDSSLTVSSKAATVVADAKSKIYGAANPALTAVVTGTVGSDTLSYTLATTALTNSGVGSYPITVTLGANPNYSVTKTDSSLTVNSKAATVVADAKSKIYGAANPALTAVVTGTVGSDTLSYTLATTALTNSGVGSYPITVTLGANPNYSVTKTDSSLTVNPKAATVVADAKSKIYGAANPALTAVVTGTVGSDPRNYTRATTALPHSGVGSSSLTVTLGANPT